MKNFFKNERGDIGVEVMGFMIFMSLVVVVLLYILVPKPGEAKENQSYNGVSVSVADMIESGETSDVVNVKMLKLMMSKMKNADSEKVKDRSEYGANVKTLTFKKGDKTVTYEVYADNDAMYMVGDGTGVLKGLEGKKAMKFTGFDRNDMETYMETRGFLAQAIDTVF